MRHVVTNILLLALLLVTGCEASRGLVAEPAAFPIDQRAAAEALGELPDQPDQPLPRPVVVLDGFLDPGFGSRHWLGKLHEAGVDENCTARVNFYTAGDFDECHRRVVEAVREEFGDQPIDLIGLSMGGLVALDVATRGELDVRRVYTVCSPMSGAVAAARAPGLYRLVRQMRPGSAFITNLNTAIQTWPGERTHYGAENDRTVRAEEAAPVGETAILLPPIRSLSPHQQAVTDPRLILDVLHRLRGEAAEVTVRHPDR
jgi:pimeloyl-ACP methyl ester carboxylesterase